MCRVETSVGAWNTGGRFFSDVTLAYGTGTFSLIVFQRIGIVRMIPLFTPPIMPNGVLYLCKSH